MSAATSLVTPGRTNRRSPGPLAALAGTLLAALLMAALPAAAWAAAETPLTASSPPAAATVPALPGPEAAATGSSGAPKPLDLTPAKPDESPATAGQEQLDTLKNETAAPPEPDAGPSFAFGGAFLSKYVWRGLRVTDGPVFQPSATVGWKGLSLNLWGNLDLNNVNGYKGEFNEIDITLDYTRQLIGPLSGSIGMIHYQFPNTGASSTTEFYTGFLVDTFLQPSIKAYFDVDQADGVYLTTDVSHSFALPDLGGRVPWSLNTTAGFGWGSSNYNRFYYGVDSNGWNDFHTTISLPLVFFDRFTVAPMISYSALLDGDLRNASAEPDNFVYGVNLSFAF